MCIVETDHIAGKFYDRKLHSKTDTEERNFVCAGVADGFDLAFHTAVTKSAGNQDSCYILKNLICGFRSHCLGIHPFDLNSRVAVDSAVF